MALSNLNKEVSTNLFRMLSINNNSEIEKIKKNNSVYVQLEIIAEQIFNLKNKANSIIENNNINEFLHSIKMDFKKVPGTIYYHYNIEGKDLLTIISPDEWHYKNYFSNKYLYNHDFIFYKID